MEVNIVSMNERKVVNFPEAYFIFIPLSDIERINFGINIHNPCWSIKIEKPLKDNEVN